MAKSSYGKLSKLGLGWYNSNLDRTALVQNQKLQACCMKNQTHQTNTQTHSE